MTIKVDRDFVEVLPRGVGSSPYLATGHTPSMGCACLLSVAWNEHASGNFSLEWKFSGTCVSTAPAVVPAAMSFTVTGRKHL